MELEKSWASVTHQDHTDFAKQRNDRVNCPVSQQRRQRFRPMWRVREHMAFLIRNLQFYIQVIADASEFHFCMLVFLDIGINHAGVVLCTVFNIVIHLLYCTEKGNMKKLFMYMLSCLLNMGIKGHGEVWADT
jgi:hypothetical protein